MLDNGPQTRTQANLLLASSSSKTRNDTKIIVPVVEHHKFEERKSTTPGSISFSNNKQTPKVSNEKDAPPQFLIKSTNEMQRVAKKQNQNWLDQHYKS